MEEVFHLETVRVIGNDWVVRHDNRYFQVKAQARQYAPAKGKVTVWEWEDGRLQSRYRGRAVAREELQARFQFSRKTQGDHGQASNAAHSPSGSPLAAGLSQDAPLEQTSDPDDAYYHAGLACGFAVSSPNLDHPTSEVGANWRQPKNNNSKPGGERLWKSRFVEKSTKRTSPALEIRTHRGSHFTHSLTTTEDKNPRPHKRGHLV